jgi:hypothetical protein
MYDKILMSGEIKIAIANNLSTNVNPEIEISKVFRKIKGRKSGYF